MLHASRIRAEGDAESDRLTNAVDEVDEKLVDAESELDDVTGELEEAMREVERLTKEAATARSKVEELQAEFDRAFEAWQDHVDRLPEDAEFYEPLPVSDYFRTHYN